MDRKFSILLKEYLSRSGLSQKNLGDKAGVSAEYINMLLKGSKKPPSYEVIEKICKALNLRDDERYHLLKRAAREKTPKHLWKYLDELEKFEKDFLGK